MGEDKSFFGISSFVLQTLPLPHTDITLVPDSNTRTAEVVSAAGCS